MCVCGWVYCLHIVIYPPLRNQEGGIGFRRVLLCVLWVEGKKVHKILIKICEKNISYCRALLASPLVFLIYVLQ